MAPVKRIKAEPMTPNNNKKFDTALRKLNHHDLSRIHKAKKPIPLQRTSTLKLSRSQLQEVYLDKLRENSKLCIDLKKATDLNRRLEIQEARMKALVGQYDLIKQFFAAKICFRTGESKEDLLRQSDITDLYLKLEELLN